MSIIRFNTDLTEAYSGVIIEESLKSTAVLNLVNILGTKACVVTAEHKTPWVKEWTMHTVEVPVDNALLAASMLAKALDTEHGHAWYADFKNKDAHYIIFSNKIFCVDRRSTKLYEEVKKYGIKLGIPAHQLDFDK
ncbi:MAG: hypothetical protein FWE53_04235 [Firmicutes bacterium]|nr:hypothetical protein [Bacillota bacterium]